MGSPYGAKRMILFLAKLLLARNPAMTLSYARRMAKLGLAAFVLIALVVVVLGFRWWLAGERKEARQEGAVTAVSAGQETTLRQIGEANEAGNQVRNNAGDARYRQCLQDVEPGYESSCERYRPVEPMPD